MDNLFYLLNGLVMTEDELRQYYRHNMLNMIFPVSGWFCPACYHELAQNDDGSFYRGRWNYCPHCNHDLRSIPTVEA